MLPRACAPPLGSCRQRLPHETPAPRSRAATNGLVPNHAPFTMHEIISPIQRKGRLPVADAQPSSHTSSRRSMHLDAAAAIRIAMTRHRPLFLAAALFAIFVIAQPWAVLGAEECLPPADRAALSSLLDRYIAAVNAHDTSSFATIFTDGYIQHSGRSPSLARGRRRRGSDRTNARRH